MNSIRASSRRASIGSSFATAASRCSRQGVGSRSCRRSQRRRLTLAPSVIEQAGYNDEGDPPEIERWQAEGEGVVVATVVANRRTAPRPIGSSLAISKSGALCGSVSGGCVEGDVFQQAQEVFASGEPKLLSYGISDEEAWAVGLPCGGEIDVFLEKLCVIYRLLELQRSGGRAVVLTVVDGEDVGSKLLVVEGGETVGDGPPELAAHAPELIRGARTRLELEGRTVFAEAYGPPPRLFVYGAVDTAEALAAGAKAIGWKVVVADARAKFATPERMRSADELIVAWPEEAFAQVAPDHATAIVVLTHDDKFDLPALELALATDAFYVGLIGGQRNQERKRERLREAGVEAEALARIAGPVRARSRRRERPRGRALDPRRGGRRAQRPRRRPVLGPAARPRVAARGRHGACSRHGER